MPVRAIFRVPQIAGQTRLRPKGDGARMRNGSVASLRLFDGLPDLGPAPGALIDEVDLGRAPVRLDFTHEHGKQAHAARADHRGGIGRVMLDISWHLGSPSQAKPNPRRIYCRRSQTPH